MLEHWFSVIKLPLSWRQFLRLPQNPAYKYEYIEKTAWLSPRPKFYHARLSLSHHDAKRPEQIEARTLVTVRQIEARDWTRLPQVFAQSFARVQPFASLGDRRRLKAATECLKFTREGGDGPLIQAACSIAMTAGRDVPVGALLVTLVPPVDLDDLWSLRWEASPPEDCVERRLGHAHLTWIFVAPDYAGYGVGTELLAQAANSLVELGYSELVSSFILGNDSSLCWHWRNGFQLLSYVGSKRKFREMMRLQEPQEGAES